MNFECFGFEQGKDVRASRPNPLGEFLSRPVKRVAWDRLDRRNRRQTTEGKNGDQPIPAIVPMEPSESTAQALRQTAVVGDHRLLRKPPVRPTVA
jgi:hypothetical protein